MAQTAAQGTESGWRGVGTAALMSFALLVLSFVRRIGDMGTVGFHNGLLDNMLVDVRGTALGRNITLFCISLVLTHAAFGLVCWLLARLSRYAFPDVKASRVQWVVIWSAALAIWLLIENAAMFPHSSLGGPYADLVRAGPGVFNLFNIATVLLVCAALALGVSCVLRAVRARRWGRSGVQVAVTIGAAICALGIAVVYASHSTPAQLNKPHVIIIGIDSLRYDVASEKGPQSQAPNVRGFLDGAVSFSDAMTPLARTFPAWVSILTGRAPHTTGAIVNLLPRNLVHTGDTLGDLYRRA